MRSGRLILLLVAGACSSTGSPSRDARPSGEPRVRGRATIEAAVRGTIPAAGDRAAGVDLSLRPRAGSAPDALRDDLLAGRSSISLLRPNLFSFAGPALARSETPFRPESATLVLARRIPGDDEPPEGPALLRLEGTVAGPEIATVIRTVEDPQLDTRGFQEVRDSDLRVLLGHGIDVLMRMASAEQGGVGPLDTRSWVALLDGQGRPVGEGAAWLEHVADARRAGSLDPIRPYRIVVRRWRPGSEPGRKARFFRVPLALVVVCAQMSVEPRGDDFRWTWEGLWRARLHVPRSDLELPRVSWPPLTVAYSEFDVVGDSGGAIWRALLAPVALTREAFRIGVQEGEETWVDRALRRQRGR